MPYLTILIFEWNRGTTRLDADLCPRYCKVFSWVVLQVDPLVTRGLCRGVTALAALIVEEGEVRSPGLSKAERH